MLSRWARRGTAAWEIQSLPARTKIVERRNVEATRLRPLREIRISPNVPPPGVPASFQSNAKKALPRELNRAGAENQISERPRSLIRGMKGREVSTGQTANGQSSGVNTLVVRASPAQMRKRVLRGAGKEVNRDQALKSVPPGGFGRTKRPVASKMQVMEVSRRAC